MKKFNEYLDMDGGIAFNLAVYNRFSSIGDSAYTEICGGYIEGVYQWADHNIYNVDEVENGKYIGWNITFENGATRRIYIEKWVMNIMPENWKHAKCLFNKFLKEDIKFNNSKEAMSEGYGY